MRFTAARSTRKLGVSFAMGIAEIAEERIHRSFKLTKDELPNPDRRTQWSWVAVIVTAIVSTLLVTLLDQWILGGLVIGGLFLMLVVENIARTLTLGNSIQFGIALGLMAGWLLWRFAR